MSDTHSPLWDQFPARQSLFELGARMNAIDQIFGWLMIAFGVAQLVTNFRIQSSSHLSLSLQDHRQP
jgi:hypothetical protein